MRACARWQVFLVPALASAVAAQPPVPAIRPVGGLTIANVIHEERGDIEAIATVDAVAPTQYDVLVSSDIPNAADPTNPKRLKVKRTIRVADDSNSHRVNVVLATDDPALFPGATLEPSMVMLSDLKSQGKTSVIYGDAPPGAFQGPLAIVGAARRYYRGDLSRVGRTTVPVLVNGERVQLPAIEARGHLSVGADADDVDLFVFDNPSWPLTLKWSANGRAGQVTVIAWPVEGTEGPGRQPRIAAMMAKTCRAEVHGIYFSFASAKLVPESDAALEEIAHLLAANPTWVVTIEGHTDSIGTHTSNLDLSKRRAAAVRDALVARFGVPPGRLLDAGFGDSSPIESNTTIEGRARNRRVELSRKC